MNLNKDTLKEKLSIQEVHDFVADLGGEPHMNNNAGFFIARTICHNHLGEGSHKLYYYENTHLFKCFTECNDTFDIYELVCKVKSQAGENWSLPKAIHYVASYFGYSNEIFNFEEEHTKLQDWEILDNYDRINAINKEQIVELTLYDKSILNFLPHPRIVLWENEGISQEVMEARGICYNGKSCGIVIPHYDINNNLIGIRERTILKDQEEWGKYKPAILNGLMYNHPLSFNLYNINNSKDNISTIKKAIVFESEKSCLLYASYFGMENDISVACCGSNLISYQFKLLMNLHPEEIVIAFDRQYQNVGDDEWKRWTKKLIDFHRKYGAEVQISYMFDKEHILNYKASPIDQGRETFLKLFKERVFL